MKKLSKKMHFSMLPHHSLSLSPLNIDQAMIVWLLWSVGQMMIV